MKIIIATSQRMVHVLLRQRLLSEGPSHQEFFMPLKNRSEEYLNLMTFEGRSLVKKIADVDGVQRIRVWINTIGIEYSQVYEWENDLSETVMPIIFEVLGYDDPEKITIEKTTMAKLYPT